MTANRYVCIHGHFYQPPRENPWLEKIDYQESASPFHDWNSRINAECYRPNGLSRILDNDGWVVKLSNNYSRISFNFGPTLLSWIEENDPQGYASILEGDRLSRALYGGHGSALAQAYNHMILPLANRRDKITQIKWGLYDFRHRFGHDAEGMWIPETAVDLETLEIMADHGLKFVLLAPRQAQAVRPLDGDQLWESVRGERVNPRIPYLIRFESGQTIAAFFYDGPISRAVAFEGLLNNGEIFASRLCGGYDATAAGAQLSHIATDGESYGHHHLKGDMALAYALEYIEETGMAKLTNYGKFLELYPPAHEVMIYERSSWSCIHGIERWKSDCGCNSGGRRDWNQKWRKPLREAFDFLQSALVPLYEAAVSPYVKDPWKVRDDYIRLILHRSDDAQRQFFERWAEGEMLTDIARENILKALEMQRQAMLMYTSCAWFFDEISGIETVQSLAYAARALELAKDLGGDDLMPEFLRYLELAPSNIAEFGNGRAVFEQLVLPKKMDFQKVAAHIAAISLFKEEGPQADFACYRHHWKERSLTTGEKLRILRGTMEIQSRITGESRLIDLLAFHSGDYDINIAVKEFSNAEQTTNMWRSIAGGFERGDISESMNLLASHFGEDIFYLDDLRHDQQKAIIDHLMESTTHALEMEFVDIYDKNRPVMNYLTRLDIALPEVFYHLAHFVQNEKIKGLLRRDPPDIETISQYLKEAGRLNIALDGGNIGRLYIDAVKRAFRMCKADSENLQNLQNFFQILLLKDSFPFDVDLGEIQNGYAVWISRFNAGQDKERELLNTKISQFLKIRMQS